MKRKIGINWHVPPGGSVKPENRRKCMALWGTRWCINCYRFIKRKDQVCVAGRDDEKVEGRPAQ